MCSFIRFRRSPLPRRGSSPRLAGPERTRKRANIRIISRYIKRIARFRRIKPYRDNGRNRRTRAPTRASARKFPRNTSRSSGGHSEPTRRKQLRHTFRPLRRRPSGPGNPSSNAERFATSHISGSYRLAGGTFPDTATYLLGFDTRIGLVFGGVVPIRTAHAADRATPSASHRRKANPRRTGTPPHGRIRGSIQRFPGTDVPGKPENYQLAFVTPGIRPFEAISRNWIRLMPNSRI